MPAAAPQPRQQHQRRRAAQPAAQHQQVTRSVGRWKPRPFNSPSALPLRLLPKPTLPEIETPSPASLAESDTENDSPVIVSTVRTAWPARPPQQRTQQRQHPAAAARPRQPSRGRTQHPHPAAAAAAAPVARVVGQQPQQPTAASHGHYSGRGYSARSRSSPLQPAARTSPRMSPRSGRISRRGWRSTWTRSGNRRICRATRRGHLLERSANGRATPLTPMGRRVDAARLSSCFRAVEWLRASHYGL